jgi:hypothetical protein
LPGATGAVAAGWEIATGRVATSRVAVRELVPVFATTV